MFTQERYSKIIQAINITGMVSVSDLVKKLKTSESTIRRDLTILDKQGLIKKVHGGAVSIDNESSKNDHKVEMRKCINTDQKSRIAHYAASIVNDGDIIYIDAGTTTERMIDFLNAKDITVVTNGIRQAQKLIAKNIRTFILGGEIKCITEAVVGDKAIEELRKFNFSKGFFGVNGVTNENGYTTPDINEAMVKKAALESCTKPFVLADESKIEKTSFVTFAEIDKAVLITNKINDNNNIIYDTSVIEVEKND